MEVLITESVPQEELESVTLADMARFAIEQGFIVTISSDEFSIRRGDELVFHQKFFEGKIAGVIDYLTAMSKATGMYRVDVLQHLIPDKEPKPNLRSIEQILRELRFNADEDVCRNLYGFRKEVLDDILERGKCKPEYDPIRFGGWGR